MSSDNNYETVVLIWYTMSISVVPGSLNKDNLQKSLSGNRPTSPMLEVNRQHFETVKNFVYLGSQVNSDNSIGVEIRRRVRLLIGVSALFKNSSGQEHPAPTLSVKCIERKLDAWHNEMNRYF